MAAGIELVSGDAIIFMDSDLQLDPEELPKLAAQYEKGYDVVTGYRLQRKDSFLRTVPSKIANMIMRKASNTTLTDFGCTFKIFNGKLIKAFSFGPFLCFNPVTVISKAQHIKEIPVSHHARKHGQSGWTFTKLWEYQMTHIIALSERIFQYVGLLCLFGALLFGARVVLGYFFEGSLLSEVTPGLILNAIAISLLSIIAVLCLIGEFGIRTFFATQTRPGFIVRTRLNQSNPRKPAWTEAHRCPEAKDQNSHITGIQYSHS
jgi:glycosyltransferase involved in cell wall biosynthesis